MRVPRVYLSATGIVNNDWITKEYIDWAI